MKCDLIAHHDITIIVKNIVTLTFLYEIKFGKDTV